MLCWIKYASDQNAQWMTNKCIDSLVQDPSISIANALEILQSCIKPLILWIYCSISAILGPMSQRRPTSPPPVGVDGGNKAGRALCESIPFILCDVRPMQRRSAYNWSNRLCNATTSTGGNAVYMMTSAVNMALSSQMPSFWFLKPPNSY